MSSDFLWVASWVGSPVPGSTEYSRTLFRSEFETECLPQDAELRISADQSYVLYVNGVEVGRGPQRMQPRRKTHDRIDIGPYLNVGTNTLACVVTFPGRSNAAWQAPTPSGSLGSRAALLVDGHVGALRLGSWLSWRTIEAKAWSGLPGGRLEGVPSTYFDARLLDADWAMPGFDDSSWLPAATLGAGHAMRKGSGQPPVAPFGAVPERSSPHLTDTEYPAVMDSAVTSTPSWEPLQHPFERAGRLATLTFSSRASAERVRLNEGESAAYRLDFGRLVAGILEFDVDAPHGSLIDVAFLEHPDWHDDEILSSSSGARYVARGFRDAFETVERHGMRAALVLISPPPGFDGEVRISGARVREQIRPWVTAASFSAEKSDLERLWNAGVRTVQLNTADGFVDCPTREQRAWVGDGVVHAGVHLVANRDWGAVRDYLEQANSPRADGILPMSVAGDLEASDGVTIPSWSLHWLHALYEYFIHVGPDAVRHHMPTAQRILAWFDERSNNGVLGSTGEWDLFDWASVYVGDESAALTALWGRGLAEFAEIAEEVNDTGSAEWARRKYTTARGSFDRFWDADRGLYVDFLAEDTGLSSAPVSQLTNAAAILAGFASGERGRSIVETMSAPDRLVVTSLYATAEGVLDSNRWERIARGERIIDWNERLIVRAEPFCSALVHDAYRMVGRDDLVLRALRDWLPFLANGRNTFGETWQWGTTCHGWSATPTRDLARSLLGVSPASPGFTSARVAPFFGEGDFSGGVATPYGPLTVSLVGDQVQVVSPVPTEIVLAGKDSFAVPPGTHCLNVSSLGARVPAGARA